MLVHMSCSMLNKVEAKAGTPLHVSTHNSRQQQGETVSVKEGGGNAELHAPAV